MTQYPLLLDRAIDVKTRPEPLPTTVTNHNTINKPSGAQPLAPQTQSERLAPLKRKEPIPTNWRFLANELGGRNTTQPEELLASPELTGLASNPVSAEGLVVGRD